jgi:hypothetical protein
VEYNHNLKRITALKLLREHMHTTNTHYNLVAMTRFDIYFVKEFTQHNISHSSFNMISSLEHSQVADDNFYLFPIAFLPQFFNLVVRKYRKTDPRNIHMLFHEIRLKLEELFPVHYVLDEKVSVRELSFFKLHFFDSVCLMPQKYLLTPNVWYISPMKTAKMMLSAAGTELTFKKMAKKKCINAWIGYEIPQQGNWVVSFSMSVSAELVHFPFLKLHNPVRFLTTPQHIPANTWTDIRCEFECPHSHDLMCLIFDALESQIYAYVRDFRLHLLENSNDNN